MGVRMETPAKVSPARLAQAPRLFLEADPLIPAQGRLSCGAVVRLVEPISKASSLKQTL